jgi:hypothetical protein
MPLFFAPSPGAGRLTEACKTRNKPEHALIQINTPVSFVAHYRLIFPSE